MHEQPKNPRSLSDISHLFLSSVRERQTGSAPRPQRTPPAKNEQRDADLTPQEFQREVEKELTGRDSEPWEIMYFKLYRSQIPVIEQAIETAAMMLGSDKSRGYCLEMICADFLAGANLDSGQPDVLLHSLTHFFQFLPGEQQQAFMQLVNAKIQ